jgi:hypothetical protein
MHIYMSLCIHSLLNIEKPLPYGRACLRILRQTKMAKLVGRRSSPLLSLMVEHPKGTESLTIHMVRVLISRAPSPLPWGRVPKGPY